MNHPAFVEQIKIYFTRRPGVWINADRLAHVGGKHAWRTRVSDCRRAYGMCIENRLRRVQLGGSGGQTFTISEYRYIPALVEMELVEDELQPKGYGYGV